MKTSALQRWRSWACGMVVAGLAAAAAAGPHEHGVVRLSVAVEGNTVTLAMNSPLDNFLGFERAPRNDRERQAAQALLQQLQQGGALFRLDAAAQCSQRSVEVQAPVLGQGGTTTGKAGDHADIDAEYSFQCQQPQSLSALDLALFDTWRRISRIEVQVVGPKGQQATTLRRPARSVRLVR